jgi:hypothetical protein
MINSERNHGVDYDDDGAGVLAIIGIVLLIAFVAAGVYLNVRL